MKSNLAKYATSTGRASLIHVTDGEIERPVALCYGADDLDGDGEMAARIAALLNFAEGVPTEELTGSLLELAAATTLATEPLAQLREALDALVKHETSPCRFDHHGTCQEHCSTGDVCHVAVARKLLGIDGATTTGRPSRRLTPDFDRILGSVVS